MLNKAHFDDSRFDADLLGDTHGAHGVAGANGEFYQAILPKQEVKRARTRFNCAPILDRAYNDCALSPQPRAWPNEAACNGLSPSSTTHSECPRCEDGVAFHGNDPAGGVRCEVCDGAGVLEVTCGLCAEEVLADRHRVIERVA